MAWPSVFRLQCYLVKQTRDHVHCFSTVDVLGTVTQLSSLCKNMYTEMLHVNGTAWLTTTWRLSSSYLWMTGGEKKMPNKAIFFYLTRRLKKVCKRALCTPTSYREKSCRGTNTEMNFQGTRKGFSVPRTQAEFLARAWLC